MTAATPIVLDSHIDIPWPDGADPFTHTDRCVDFPKMRAGGMSAGCFVAYVPQTLCDEQNRRLAAERAEAMLTQINALARANPLPVRVVARTHDIRAAVQAGAIAVIPAVENGHAMGNNLGAIAGFAAHGVRYLTLTHNGHNDLADSALPRRELGDAEIRHGGLSHFGRAAIRQMNAHGILVDVSHASKAAMMQAADCSGTPLIASHSCIRALCDHPRNLDDEQLDRLAATGGVIQVTAMPYFLRKGGRPHEVGIDLLLDHIDYAVRRIGLAHVGISSDFDGGGGITGWANAGQTANVTLALAARGYTPAQISSLWGGNFLRVLAQAEAVSGLDQVCLA